MAVNPFDALGLPTRPDLTDEQVRAAWRTIAAATHPDRPGGGDVARYTEAAAAYAVLRTPWGRSEAFADLGAATDDTSPLPAVPLSAGRGDGPPPHRRATPGQPGRRTCLPPWCSCPRGSVTAGRCAWSSAPWPPPWRRWPCWP